MILNSDSIVSNDYGNIQNNNRNGTMPQVVPNEGWPSTSKQDKLLKIYPSNKSRRPILIFQSAVGI